jgi:Ca-activated chloride channel family protein
MSSHFEFAHSWVLLLLALLPVYALLRGKAGQHAALQFPSADLARAAGGVARHAAGRLLLFLRLLVLALCIVALAGPRFANERTETRASGVDIMLALDLSWSMMALDMSGPGERTTRMDIARTVIEEFIRSRPNDRIGMVVFSAVPYLASPLTLNHDWLIRNLDRLHVGLIRELGTAIGDATASAARRLEAQRDSKSRIIILLTDGDNNRGDIDPIPAAQLAAALRAKVYTIGIGIDEPCQLPKFTPATGELELDAAGNVIPTILLQPANYTMLGRMAELANGRFYRATNLRELQSIYREIDRLEKTEITLSRSTTFTPLFQWPLLAACALLALELLLGETRYRRVP